MGLVFQADTALLFHMFIVFLTPVTCRVLMSGRDLTRRLLLETRPMSGALHFTGIYRQL